MHTHFYMNIARTHTARHYIAHNTARTHTTRTQHSCIDLYWNCTHTHTHTHHADNIAHALTCTHIDTHTHLPIVAHDRVLQFFFYPEINIQGNTHKVFRVVHIRTVSDIYSTSTICTQLIYALQSHFSKHISSSSPEPVPWLISSLEKISDSGQVCVCVYMCTCLCVRVSICVHYFICVLPCHIHINIWRWAGVCVCLYVRVCLCVCVYMCTLFHTCITLSCTHT